MRKETGSRTANQPGPVTSAPKKFSALPFACAALQVAARADPVGADPLLHPGDDLALEDDGEQRHHQEDHEDPDDLDEHDPPDVVPEVLERRLVGGGQRGHRAPTESVTTEPGVLPSTERTSL